MKLDWKVIIVGGLLMYVAEFAVSMMTAMFIHEGVLDPYYIATTEFWRPELTQDPPDMAALMPRWILTGLVIAFVQAAIYDNIRAAFNGSAIITGLKFGLLLAIIFATFSVAYSGVFNLPDAIWAWWTLDTFIIYPIGGLVLGWFVGKYGSE